MALIVTPRQLAQRSELYHQLAALTTAGVGIIQGLEMVRKAPPARSFKRPLTQLIERLKHGATFSEGLASLGNWLPAFDLALLNAAERSGRIDASFRQLSNFYDERARLARTVISNLLYPAVTLHVALFVFPPHLLRELVWEGNVAGFLAQKLSVFGPLYGVLLLGLYVCQGRHGEWWRSQVERVARTVPILGSARKSLALARLSAALDGLLNSGVSIIDAWELAAASSGSPALRRAVQRWRPKIEAGQTPAELVGESSAFPELFTSLYTTGELSGQIDDALRRLYQHYQEDASRKFKAVAEWTPRLVYFIILLLVAYSILSFWIGYYSGVIDAID